MNTKYNGFNNGRDTSDGIGGNPAYEGMNTNQTPEEIAEQYAKDNVDESTFSGTRDEIKQAFIDGYKSGCDSMAERNKELELGVRLALMHVENIEYVYTSKALSVMKSQLKQLLSNQNNKK